MTVNLEKLKVLRNERCLSLAQVSESLGFKSHQAYLYKENGSRDITADELGKLAVLFDVPVESLYTSDAQAGEGITA